jgi:hypothetical protein
MAKARPTRARRPPLQVPTPVRILKSFEPLDRTDAIKDLMATAGGGRSWFDRAWRGRSWVMCS